MEPPVQLQGFPGIGERSIELHDPGGPSHGGLPVGPQLGQVTVIHPVKRNTIMRPANRMTGLVRRNMALFFIVLLLLLIDLTSDLVIANRNATNAPATWNPGLLLGIAAPIAR